MVWIRKARTSQERCAHLQRVAVSTAGVERLACEECGHVSFSFQEGLGRPVGREVFAREADDRPDVPATGFEKAGAQN